MTTAGDITPADSVPKDHGRATGRDPPGGVCPHDRRTTGSEEIGAVVVSARGGPAGLISERDLITILASGGDPDTHQAADVMTADLMAAQPGDSIASVGRLMLDAGVRHVVVRDGDSVVGLVSIRDVLAILLGSTDARRRRRLPMVGSGADLAGTAPRDGLATVGEWRAGEIQATGTTGRHLTWTFDMPSAPSGAGQLSTHARSLVA